MTLRQKTLLIIAATLVGLIALLYVAFDATLIARFRALEEQNARVNVIRLLSTISSRLRDLEFQVRDAAQSDDLYRYMRDRKPAYLDNLLASSTFENNRLNLMALLDREGNIVASAGYDLARGKPVPLSATMLMGLENRRSLLIGPPEDPRGNAGLLILDDIPMLVVSSPIRNGSGQGQARGTLVWARYLDTRSIQSLSSFMQAPVSAALAGAEDLEPHYVTALQAMSPAVPVTTLIIDDETIAGYGLLSDLTGERSLIVRVTMPRSIYAQARETVSWFLLALVACGLVVTVVILILLDRLVLVRIARLTNAVRDRATGPAGVVSAPVNGSDELARLGMMVHPSLDALEKSKQELEKLNQELEQRVSERTAELERQNSFLETVLNSMNEGVIYGREDCIEYANQMMEELTGYRPDELIGEPQSILFGVTPPVERRRISAFHKNQSPAERWIQRGERKLRCKDGTVIEVAYAVTPLPGRQKDMRMLTIIRDVTEEKALQARRDRFLANASHELRTPLSNLITRLYLLRRQPEEFEQHLDVLDSVAMHMRSLIEDLLDVSRFRKGTLPLKRERLSLSALITEVVEVQRYEAQQKEQTLTLSLPDEPVYIFADRKRFVQIMTNLIVNAINYTPRGGKIDVTLAVEPAPGGSFAVVRVKDTGIGIAPENLEQIFQPFYRVSQETPGSGLGLSIVKEILDHHGGSIDVQSAPGEGSTFTVRIATLPPEIETAEKQASA